MRPSLRMLCGRFLKLGCTAYGGPAMIGQIQQATVNDCGWMKGEDFLQGLALCQMIPGATVPQMVAYVGYRLRGIPGALVSFVAYLLPPFIALVALSTIYFTTQAVWFRGALFKGLSAIVVAIVLNACITLGKPVLRDWQAVLISLLAFFGFLFRLNIVVILVSAAMAAFFLYKNKRQVQPPPLERPAAAVKKADLCYLGLLGALIASGFVCSYFIDPQLTYLSLRLAKIGTLMFGGGFTVIPLIQYEVVDEFHWISTKEFLDGIALGQVTPGPMMITAFIGTHHSGLFGAVMATVAIMSPSFFILLLLLPYHDHMRNAKLFRTMERGILASFIGMLGLVLYTFARTACTDIPTILLAGAAYFALFKKVGLPYVVLIGGLLSIVLFGSLL